MANDLFDSLRTYINKVSVNEKSAAEIANSVNAWVRESGEAVKQKIEEEVESTVLRMGFVKRAEFDALAAEVARLRNLPHQKRQLPRRQLLKKLQQRSRLRRNLQLRSQQLRRVPPRR